VTVPDLRTRVMRGLSRVFHVARLVVVSVVCLLIGVAARQLFDAWGLERMPFLKKEPVEAEVHVIVTPPPDIQPSREPVEPF